MYVLRRNKGIVNDNAYFLLKKILLSSEAIFLQVCPCPVSIYKFFFKQKTSKQNTTFTLLYLVTLLFNKYKLLQKTRATINNIFFYLHFFGWKGIIEMCFANDSYCRIEILLPVAPGDP